GPCGTVLRRRDHSSRPQNPLGTPTPPRRLPRSPAAASESLRPPDRCTGGPTPSSWPAPRRCAAACATPSPGSSRASAESGGTAGANVRLVCPWTSDGDGGALRVPGMTLPLGVLEPRIQRVVDDEPTGEQLVIIRKQLRQPQRDGEQSCRLRGKVQTIRVRPADDNRQLVQGRISQAVLLQEGVEAAQRPIVRKLHTFDIVRDRIELGGARVDLGRRCKEKLCLR